MAEPEPQGTNQKFEALAIEPVAGDIGDVIIELRLPRETLALGAKVPVTFTRRVASTDGETKVEATIEVDVPPRSGAGMQLRVVAQGHVRHDKPLGDVVVVLATATEESSQAAQKLPSFIALVVVTIIVLVLALRMAR